jgi:hypothetical protein
MPSCRAHLGFDPLDVFISPKHRPKCSGRVHRLLERDAAHVAEEHLAARLEGRTRHLVLGIRQPRILPRS